MESQRLILFFVFAFSLFLLFDAWQRDQQPAATRTPAAVTAQKDTGVPPAPSEKLVPVPSVPAASGAPTTAGTETGQIVNVETDVYKAEISTTGGDLRRLELLKHRDVE